MSDHISGPRALEEPIADITDVYAFPSPEQQGHLVLVQNTLPFAQPSAPFSDGLVYRFRLRPLAAGAPSDPAPFAVAEEEFVFDCVFSDPAAGDGARRQEGACTTPAGDMVTFRVNDEQGGSGHGLRVFAGLRWDPFNMEDTFRLPDSDQGAYLARLNANLAFWDGLDGKTDWPTDDNGTHPLTELVLADYLVVDPSKPYADQGSFLEIERAAREGRAHETCGGRALNDDVMDTIFTLLINAGKGPVIRHGVDQSTRPAPRSFPYLAPANPDPPEPPEHH